MLSVSDLINIQYIPEISDISLSLLVDFYEQYLCKRIFIFELADGQKLKLFFKDTSEDSVKIFSQIQFLPSGSR